MKCALCSRQKARRACPALGQQICAVCCGTKRLTEIQCPADCSYLASAREHPPAATLRRQHRDVGLLVNVMRDLNSRQSELFLLVLTFLTRHEPAELPGIPNAAAGSRCSPKPARAPVRRSSVTPRLSFDGSRKACARCVHRTAPIREPFSHCSAA